MRRLLLLLLLGAACSPREFLCSRANECLDKNGQPGLCLEHHCALPDLMCASGFRWDDTAGAEANQCVDREVLPADAGRDAAFTPDARLPDAQ